MSENSGGCLKWFFIGLIVIGLTFFLLGIGGYYVLFHTAWPVRKAVEAMIADTDIEVEGIEGSISSGLSVKKIRIPDNYGNVTEIDDIAFKYENDGDTFIINDIHVTRAHIFVDNLLERNEDAKADSNNINKNKPLEKINAEQKNLIVKKIDITNVTIENKKNGTKFTIDKIYLDGFEVIDNKLKLGTLTVKSDYCNINIKPVDSSIKLGMEHIIKGIISKGIHKSFIKDITISGKLLTKSKDYYKMNLALFDDKVKIYLENPNYIWNINVQNFSPNDYISSIFCIRDINFKYAGKDKKYKADLADFKIGSKLFKIDKSLFEKNENKDLTAVCKNGKIEYKCIIKDNNNGMPKFKLSSNPEMTSKDILGMLLFDSKYENLSTEQKSNIDEELKKAE